MDGIVPAFECKGPGRAQTPVLDRQRSGVPTFCSVASRGPQLDTTPQPPHTTQHGKKDGKKELLTKLQAAARMLFKHQLPRPLHAKDTPLLEAEAAPSTAGSPTSVLIAAKAGRRRLHIFKWKRFLGVVEAPAEVTCCKLVSMTGEGHQCMSLVVGCRSGSVYRVEDVEARISAAANGDGRCSTGMLCLGSEHLCLSSPDDTSQIDKLIVGSREGAKESSDQTVVAVVRRDADTVVHLVWKDKDTPPADYSKVVLDSPGHPLACLPAPTDGNTILLHVSHDRNQGPPTPSGGFQLYFTPLVHDTTIKDPQKRQAVRLHVFHKQVVAVLPVPIGGNKGVTLVAIERDGLLSLLPDPRATKTSQSKVEQVRMARLSLSPATGGLQAAVLVGNSDIIACLSTRGSVWFSRLSILFPGIFFDSSNYYSALAPPSSSLSSSNINCMRVDCGPEVIALAAPSSSTTSSSTSSSFPSSSPQQAPILYLLTRRGRILCFQSFPSIPHPYISRVSFLMSGAATAAASSTAPHPLIAGAVNIDADASIDETETLLNQIERACHQTKASHQQIAHTEEAIEKVRTAWTVLAGKGLLETFLDVIHPSSSSPSPSSFLKVRLHNPAENETLPLQGWSLIVRIEAASASAAQGPSALLLPVISQPAAAVLSGASWGLDDIGPGEDFEAHMVLPVTGSLLPHTVRVTLCCPFAGAGDGRSDARASSPRVQQQKEVGVCLELGSRPLDVLDLARPPKTVPFTPAGMRTMEAIAAKRGRNQNWEGSLAQLLFEKVTCNDNEDGCGDERRGRKEECGKRAAGGILKGGDATIPMALPRPLISSTLRILWPAAPMEMGKGQAMDGDAISPVCLPALVDLLGPCDGAKIIEEGGGRALALQAPGSKLLLARLLAGKARIRMDDEENSEATGLQLSLTGTDQGLVSLLRAACCQRLGVGGSVRARRLPLTDTRMKTLETAHHQATALAAELQEAIERDVVEVVEEEGTLGQAQEKCLQKRLALARRVVKLAVVLAKEVDEAFLLDLRPDGFQERGFEKEGAEADGIQDEEGYFRN